MIRKTVKWFILAPVSLLIVLFAVANRQVVTISLDPFSSDTPAFAASLPLFLALLLALILGVIVGGVAAWLRQGKWRRTARRLEAELTRYRAEVESLRQHPQPEGAASPPGSLTPLAYRHPPAA